MYVLGLITRCIPPNNRTIHHYSIDFYKETYCSCTSSLIKPLDQSTLYLDNQLNNVKRNNQSVEFMLLILRCPVYQIIRLITVDISVQNSSYGRRMNNTVIYNLIIIVRKLSRGKPMFVSETIESDNAKRIQKNYQNYEVNVRNEPNNSSDAHLRHILFLCGDLFWYLQHILRWKINNFVHIDIRISFIRITRLFHFL